MSTDPIGKFLGGARNVVESRSSTLVPLQWNMAILVALMSFLVLAKAPFWLEHGTFILLAFVVLQAGFAYHFFMKRDSVALRSEQHAERNKELDHRVFGDPNPKDNEKQLPVPHSSDLF
jgi:membrane protein implicated in regulation of membrane protease activity